MALQGSLKEMTVADLIQHNCLDNKTARLTIDQNGQSALLFFKDGQVSHAAMGDLQGEEVVFQILNWHDGRFTLEMGFESPTESISRSWSGLLLEGARRLDELSEQTNGSPNSPSVTYANGAYQDRLSDVFEGLSDIEGMAVIGVDGEVLAARLPQAALDQDEVGAIGAAILGLSKRSVGQLKRSNFKQAFLQGTQGNIIITNITDEVLFVGLTPNDVNMGFVFAEAREITAKVRDVLSNY
ncbi:MAG TPA: DUF4388 domain-containing protein [Anaerolineae bacterium]|nr:DUF4388 domain-containing protein [Anaerolineae bacterium]MCB0223289.1 DUF4388 domain-containing protein [Anaerolineae bacterium]MCB9107557.1 DUF4388 domain-containing protein [Anaerolineales bacterium]HRV92578.1 DUF4388 domain-containing protein [Anaerolineae bacterium]